MSDTISRAKAIAVIRKNHYRLQGKGMTEEVLIADLEALPSSERQGKWILSDLQSIEEMENGNYYYFCSNCLRSDLHAKTQEVPYCWYCGARMLNGGEE